MIWKIEFKDVYGAAITSRTVFGDITNLSINLKYNSCGTVEFDIYPSDPMYDSITVRKTQVWIYKDDAFVIAAEVKQTSLDIGGTKHVYAVDLLGWLNNFYVHYQEETDPEESINTLQAQLDLWITGKAGAAKYSPYYGYNRYLDDGGAEFRYRKMHLGTVDATLPTDTASIGSGWYTILDLLQKTVSSVGGYLKLRYTSGTFYIDVSKTDSTDPAINQEIRFGINLLSMNADSDISSYATMAVGWEEIQSGDSDPSTWEYYPVNDAVKRAEYGDIMSVIDCNNLDDDAIDRAKANWLATHNNELIPKIMVTAQDLSDIGCNTDSLKLYDWVNVELEPWGISQKMLISECSIFPGDPGQNSYSFNSDITSVSTISMAGGGGATIDGVRKAADVLRSETFSRLEAVDADIQDLEAETAKIAVLEVKVAVIDTLDSKYASIAALNATNANVRDLDTSKLSAADAAITYATIGSLNATNADVAVLDADVATVKSGLSAANASIGNIQANYVDVARTNINEAWIKNLMIQGQLLSQSGSVFNLVGVHISGDLIDANTLKADRILLRNSTDGLYYELNTRGGTDIPTGYTEAQLKDGLLGREIVAHSITTDQLVTNVIMGTGAWLRLDNGTFSFSNAVTHGGISWDGEHLLINADSVIIGDSTDVAAEIENITEDINGETAYSYTSGGVTYEVFHDDNGYYYMDGNTRVSVLEEDLDEDDDGNPLIHNVGGYSERISEAEKNIESAREDVSGLRSDAEDMAERIGTAESAVEDISGSVSDITGDVEDLTEKVQRNTEHRELIESGIDIVRSGAADAPYIKIHAVTGEGANSVKITSEELQFIVNGAVQAYLKGETFVAPNFQTESLYMRNTSGEESTGLGWYARPNGHLSLMPIEGGDI